MADSRPFDVKMRPKSCEIVREKSEWKRSFQDRKSVFEPPLIEPSPNKSMSSARLSDSPTPRIRTMKKVNFLF